MFNASFFKGNRDRFRTHIPDSVPFIMTANGLLQKGSDETFPFHQDASFYYLTGITEPDIICVIDGDEEYLIVPGRSISREAFDGRVSDEALTKNSGIKTIYDAKEGWKHLSKRVKQTKRVATFGALPAYVEGWDFYSNPARAALVTRLQDTVPGLSMVDLRSKLAAMRMVKQDVEVAAIKQAIAITNQALDDITANLQAYKYEYEIEADLSAGFRKRGSTGHAFSPIVASGANACTMHYLENNAKLHKNDFIVVDVGAAYAGYAADITRTLCQGTPTKRQQAVYDAVKAAQDYALEYLKPGVKMRDYEQAMEQFVGEKLQELKLISKISHDKVRYYFPHATSHFLGLDTHDAGDYDQPLQPGIVMTIEPGIYIPEEGIGVRLEADVLITADGAIDLSL